MTKICPACGAEARDGDLECSFCGSRIIPVSLSFQQREDVSQLVQDLNKLMIKEKKRLLRQTDLVSIAVWFFGIVLILIAGMLLDSNNIHLGLLTFSAMVLIVRRSYRRKRLVNGLIRFFRKETEPQIREITNRLMLPRWQFDQMAARELKENDLLRKFMFFRSLPRK